MDLQQEIIQSIHSGIGPTLQAKSTGGHLGQNKTREKVTKRYYWPNIKKDVADFIATCDRCQRAKKLKLHKTNAEMHPVHIPNEIWSQIGIDLVVNLTETEEGYKHVLSVVDYFTKWVEIIPMKTKKGQEVGHHLFKLMTRWGCPKVIISDQGREFNNELNHALFTLTGVEHRVTAPYHPQVC